MSPALRVRNCFVLIGLLFAFPALTFGQLSFRTDGGEYEISGPINGDQTAPAVAINGNGGWSLWQDQGLDGHGFGIGARRLDNNLHPLGAAFVFNSITAAANCQTARWARACGRRRGSAPGRNSQA